MKEETLREQAAEEAQRAALAAAKAKAEMEQSRMSRELDARDELSERALKHAQQAATQHALQVCLLCFLVWF